MCDHRDPSQDRLGPSGTAAVTDHNQTLIFQVGPSLGLLAWAFKSQYSAYYSLGRHSDRTNLKKVALCSASHGAANIAILSSAKPAPGPGSGGRASKNRGLVHGCENTMIARHLLFFSPDGYEFWQSG